MATHSSILGWRILPEEPGRLQFMGSQRVRPDWATKTFTFTFTLPQTLPYLRQKSLRDCMLPLLVLASFLLPYRLLFSMCPPLRIHLSFLSTSTSLCTSDQSDLLQLFLYVPSLFTPSHHNRKLLLPEAPHLHIHTFTPSFLYYLRCHFLCSSPQRRLGTSVYDFFVPSFMALIKIIIMCLLPIISPRN